MTLMEFTMFPLDKGVSLSTYVARILDIVDDSGMDYRLTPMGTIVEGQWSDLLALVDRCFNSLSEVSDRISLSVKLDYRKGRADGMLDKVESVTQKSGRTLKTI